MPLFIFRFVPMLYVIFFVCFFFYSTFSQNLFLSLSRNPKKKGSHDSQWGVNRVLLARCCMKQKRVEWNLWIQAKLLFNTEDSITHKKLNKTKIKKETSRDSTSLLKKQSEAERKKILTRRQNHQEFKLRNQHWIFYSVTTMNDCLWKEMVSSIFFWRMFLKFSVGLSDSIK